MKEAINAIFVAVGWFVGGYTVMLIEPENGSTVGFMGIVVGLILYEKVMRDRRNGKEPDPMLEFMLGYTPLILMGLGLILRGLQ